MKKSSLWSRSILSEMKQSLPGSTKENEKNNKKKKKESANNINSQYSSRKHSNELFKESTSSYETKILFIEHKTNRTLRLNLSQKEAKLS